MSYSNLIIIGSCLCLVAGMCVYFFFYPQWENHFPARRALERCFESGGFQIQAEKGHSPRNVVYEDMEFTNLEGFPPGTVLKIQKINFALNSPDIKNLTIDIQNARLKFPYSEPIIVQGTLKDGILNFNAYSNSVELKEILSLFPDRKEFKEISGTVRGIDLLVRGPVAEPTISGKFVVEKLNRKNFTLAESPGRLYLQLRDFPDQIKRFGVLTLKNGTLSSKTTTVQVEPSKILFSEVPAKTIGFDVHGNSRIEKIKINIIVKGTLAEPDLQLTSDPPLPQPQLLLMVATGKSWQGTEKALEEGQMSTDLAKDFIDFFIFSGEGGKFAERLGISDFTLKYDAQTKGIGVKKDLTDKAGVGYGIEEFQESPGKSSITQKLEGELHVTDTLSIDVEKKIKQEREKDNPAPIQQQTDDRIFLKYKTKF